jgi:hypothetical protein
MEGVKDTHENEINLHILWSVAHGLANLGVATVGVCCSWILRGLCGSLKRLDERHSKKPP